MKNSVKEVLFKLTGLSPKAKFAKDMKELMLSYGAEASQNSLRDILTYLKSKEREIVKGDFEVIEEIVEREYNRRIPEIKNTLLKYRESLYKSYKRKLPIAKMVWINQLDETAGELSDYTKGRVKSIEIDFKKEDATISTNLNMADLRAIEYLTVADIVYLKGHATDNFTVKEITAEMVTARKNGVLANQLVTTLQANFAEITPTDYANTFGERSYWEGVVRYYSTITRTATTLNDLNTAGQKTYRWYARMTERTCLICGELHNKVFDLQPALTWLDKYYAYAEKGDIKGLKRSNPWLKNKEQAEGLGRGTGFFPPAHFRCECFIRMDLGHDYK